MNTLFSIATAFAQTGNTIVINPNIPGNLASTTNNGWIGSFVYNFYQFALLIAGILALGAIVYGGVKYAASAGNPSAQSDGKEWILAAIYGLLLLGAAYIILFTVNPNLVQLNPPNITPISIMAPPNVTTTPPSPGGLQCKNGACVPLIGAACKNGCSADPVTAQMVTCIQGKLSQSNTGIIITEAMPPSSAHQSACHNNGCCIDTAIANFSSCAQVSALINAAQACGGFGILNEYFFPPQGPCPGSKSYQNTTGNNVHIQAC